MFYVRDTSFLNQNHSYETVANVSATKDKVLKEELKKKVTMESLADLSLKAICLSCLENCLMTSKDFDCFQTFCPVVHCGNFLEQLKNQMHCFSNLFYFLKTFYCDIQIDDLPSTDSMCYILLSHVSVTKPLNIGLSMKISNVTKSEIKLIKKEQPEISDLCCTKEITDFTDTDLNSDVDLVNHSDCIIQHKTCTFPEVKGNEENKIFYNEDSIKVTKSTCKDCCKQLKDMEINGMELMKIKKHEKTKEKCVVKQTELENSFAEKLVISKEGRQKSAINSFFNDADDEMSILMELVANKSIYLKHVRHSARETALRNPEIYMIRSPATKTHPDKVMGIPWANFERETLRMASFSSYPQTAAQSAALLADSGFIYVGEGKTDKVICFFCHMVKENWKREDDIFLVHKSASPYCPIVLVLQMNNVASITGNDTSAENSRRSGNTWPPSIGTNNQSSQLPVGHLNAVFAPSNATDSINRYSPNLGSAAPYLMLPRATPMQSVQTVFGSNNQTRQQSLSQSSIETSRQSQSAAPNPILQLNRNIRPQLSNANSNNSQHATHPNINSQIYSIPRIPLSVQPFIANNSNESDVPVRELNLQDLGIFHERPKKPEYAILAKREESFEGWPADCPVSNELVAKSGVYYEGYGDSGRCFFCGGGLRKWEIGDDPFVEHARWYPRCGYIRQYMGQGFVDIVQKIKSKYNNTIQINREMVLQKMRKKGLTIANEFDEAPVENDPAVKSVLDEFKETQIYSRDEIIKVAKTLRNDGMALSSDVLYAKLSKIRSRVPPEQATPVAGATSAVGSSPVTKEDIEALREENSTLRNNLICKICMDKEVKIVFLPCGHLVSCQECSVAFVDCPICRSHIRAYVRATIR